MYVKVRIEEQRRKEFHGEKTVDDRFKAQSRDRLTFEARALAAWATQEFSSSTLAEFAKQLGRDSSTMTCGDTAA
jgi:hypothetical protein